MEEWMRGCASSSPHGRWTDRLHSAWTLHLTLGNQLRLHTPPMVREGKRYNFSSNMQSLRYALVAYIKSPIEEFVESLRRELHPNLPHLAAHLTLLPPRPIRGSEDEALRALSQVCRGIEPFEVTLGEMESFIPTTCTIYIGVAHGAERLQDLHQQLNRQALAHAEEWPYVPHLTIAKMMSESAAGQAIEIARQRWREYSGSRRIQLDRLTFVREQTTNSWVDLAPIALGGTLVSR